MAFCEIITLCTATEKPGEYSLKKETKTPDKAATTLITLARIPVWQRIDYIAPDGTEDSIVPEQLCFECEEDIPDVERAILDLATELPGSEHVTLVFDNKSEAQSV